MNTNSKFKTVATNRSASHEYFIGEKYECGIVLFGTEVKSVATSNCGIKDSFVRIENGEAFVYGFHVSSYDKGNIWNKEEDRPKKLLLHKHELRKLSFAFKEGGVAIIPLSVYFKEGKAKMEIAVCKGKHTYDKRNSIKNREINREIERNFKEERR